MAPSIASVDSAVLVGGADWTESAAGAAGDSGPISTASTTALTRERTAKLLFDVPGLELDAPIEIHPKAGGDVERLEKQNDSRVFKRPDPRVTPGARATADRSTGW